MMTIDQVKKAVGIKACEFIHNGMVVGLGTGTTAHYFIEQLIELCKQGLKIQAVASSELSHQIAKRGGIPLLDVDKLIHLDVYVDGADEIDEKKRMIKGGGGALVREKIIASISKEMIVIVDETKLSQQIGHRKLPVEIIPFAYRATCHMIEKLGFKGALRTDGNDKFFVTDNGNYIFDIQFPSLPADPEKVHQSLINLPGVVETGFFFHLAGRVIVGFKDGQIAVKS